MINNRLFLLFWGCILFRRFLFRRLLLRHLLPPLLLRNLLRLPGGVGMNGGFTLKLRGGVDDGRLRNGGGGSHGLLPLHAGRGGGAHAALQRCLHFLGTPVALRRGESAGLQHNFPQRLAPIDGRRQGLAGKTAILRLLTLRPGGNAGRQRQERQGAPVHHPIENHAQRIDICLRAVVLAVGHLRGHVAYGAGHGAGAGALGYLGDAEVTQLEFSPVGHQNVFRLDVPVDDAVLLAGQQSIAHVQPQAEHGGLLVLRTQRLPQRIQQLHTDVNIPADAVVVLDEPHVIAADHILAAAQLLGQAVFVHQLAHLVFIMGRDALRAEGLGDQLLDLPIVPGHRQLLQRALLHSPAGQGTVNLIHPAEAPFADLANDLPVQPGGICKFACHENPLLF